MDRKYFGRWIGSETNKAFREQDLKRVKILLSWYEAKFGGGFATSTFKDQLTNQIIAYHKHVKSSLWISSLIDEELSKSNHDISSISGNRDGVNTILELDNSFIIFNPDSISQIDIDSINNGSLLEVKSLIGQNKEPIFSLAQRKIKFAPKLSSLKHPQDLITTLEAEIEDFDKIVIISELEFVVDVVYALELSAVKRRIEIYDLIRHDTITRYLQVLDIGEYFRKIYGFGDFSGPGTSGVVNHLSNNKAIKVVEESIDESKENWVKQKLMISDDTCIEAIQKILMALNKNLNILLLGETGVGKSYIAETLHQQSDHESKPFLKVNCSVPSESLLATELFGAVPGAYTGVPKDGMKGMIESAKGGILFLDEIFDAHPSIQAKLLTFLDDRTYFKVGGHIPQEGDVRIIFATNKKVSEIVSDPGFRADFYYRISGHSVTIPPLRERPKDIANIFNICFQDVVHRLEYRNLSVAPNTITLVKELRWLGNVRQLIKTIEKIVIHCEINKLTTVTPDLFRTQYKEINNPKKFEKLELLLDDFFLQWEHEKEKFVGFLKSNGKINEDEKTLNYLDGFIKPIIADFFIKKYDKNYSRKDVYKAVGMNAERTDSHLALNAKKYPLLREYFSKKGLDL